MGIGAGKIKVNIEDAITPVIISASRATDIPAYYSSWFMDRLNAGYVKWKNPFNGMYSYVSFEKVRVFVFWTKDAYPMIPLLDEIKSRGYNYYFQYTLNNYEREGIEPGLRKLDERIDTFSRLSEKIGKEKVILRFDPLILTKTINVETLLERIEFIGRKLHGYTNKLVISFADISTYRKVRNNMKRQKIEYIDFDEDSMIKTAKGLMEINGTLNLEIATCCESIDLSDYDIKKNKCIDDELLLRLFPEDIALTQYLRKSKKDPGQRKGCRCIKSKDIGQYDTCPAGCVYCYANTSPETGRANYSKKISGSESII